MAFFGIFVSRVFLVDAYRFAFFFRIEAEVFQQQHFARFQCCGSVSGLGAIGSEFYGYAQFL